MSAPDPIRMDADFPFPEAEGRPASQEAPASSPMAYVYGVGRDDGSLAPLVRTTHGVDGHGVGLVATQGLVALVSAVPADVFDEAALRRQLEDLDRLEGIARAHHAVVDAAFAQAVVLPFRLATVYLDEARVAAMLVDHHDRFTELLAWLDGHVELGVKVHADPESAPPSPQGTPRSAGGPTSPGRAYLQQRMQQRRGTEDLYRAAAVVAGNVTKMAQQLARAVVEHRPQQGDLSGRTGVNIANYAFLVPTGAEKHFREEVEAAARSASGVEVAVTGPWAPYSFAGSAVDTAKYGDDEGAVAP
ncbi:GvpL/GvpF family gas vesicle protein [Streptomyces sp. NPDC058286]|uniref:GvpL/GvpF family gas vesicle protein n=1 Tax=Streptomyces sp. NPDC058286 TaxID=3346422 RepID=UPI0036ED0837